MEIRGIYKHFKGNEYEVIGEVLEHCTEVNYVLYKQLYAPFDFWIRPKEMFFSEKNVDDIMIPRFVRISDGLQDNLKDIDIYKILIKHSETEELYKIIDTKDNYFIIDKANLEDYLQLVLNNINSLLERIEEDENKNKKN